MKSFLGYSDPAPPPPEPDEPPSITDRVRGALRNRPGAYITTHQLTIMTGLSMAQVNGALSTLYKRGCVDRLLGGKRGQHSGQSYRWNLQAGPTSTTGATNHGGPNTGGTAQGGGPVPAAGKGGGISG